MKPTRAMCKRAADKWLANARQSLESQRQTFVELYGEDPLAMPPTEDEIRYMGTLLRAAENK